MRLTLIYGILALGKQYPGRILGVDELRAILASNRVAVAVEDAIPDIRDQLDRLQEQLEDVTGEVYQEPGGNRPGRIQALVSAAKCDCLCTCSMLMQSGRSKGT